MNSYERLMNSERLRKEFDEATENKLGAENWCKLCQLIQSYDKLGPLARRELETRCFFQNGFVGSGHFEREAYRIFNNNNIGRY